MSDDLLLQAEPAVEVVARGAPGAARYAERKLRHVMATVDVPILHARVKLMLASDPAVDRPARAQATLDVNGRLVRAEIAAHTMHEAVDLLESRLRGRLRRCADRQIVLHRRPGVAEPGEWRHGQVPGERPPRHVRPPDERQVVRRKTFAIDELTIAEAMFDMEMLDFVFYLFRELATGVDAVLYRMPDGRLGLQRLLPSDMPPADETVGLEPGAAPQLALDAALEWLNVADEPFVFFRDRETGGANVLYRRYDGDYGLITPADVPAPPAAPSTARRRLRDELDRLTSVREVLARDALDQETEAESVGELSSIDQHPADLGSETFERERELSLLEDVEAEIADVRRALVRLGRGSYGHCEACGRQIPDERLSAVPAAPLLLRAPGSSRGDPRSGDLNRRAVPADVRDAARAGRTPAPAPGSDQVPAIRRPGTVVPTLANSAVWPGDAGAWPLPVCADVRHDQVDVRCDVGHFPAASPATCGTRMRGRRGHRAAESAAWIEQATQEASIMLRELATCPAVTCPTTASVVEAARIMAEANIGFLVVVDRADVPVGVVTDRDIVVRAVAAGHHHATVADVMTRHPASVRVQATVTEAAQHMANRQCRRLALTDDAGKIIGVLSLDDLLRAAGGELAEIGRAVRGTQHSHLVLP